MAKRRTPLRRGTAAAYHGDSAELPNKGHVRTKRGPVVMCTIFLDNFRSIRSASPNLSNAFTQITDPATAKVVAAISLIRGERKKKKKKKN